MRRFSQRNSLVTLSDINITPLLDLAFVLLIIFIITTPLLEQGLNLKLPQVSGRPDQEKLDPRNIRTIDVSMAGQYKMGGRMWVLDDMMRQLTAEKKSNPKLLIYIRGDQNGLYKHVTLLLDRLDKAGLYDVSLRTDPTTTSR